MASLSRSKYQILFALQFLAFLQTRVFCIQYKVGDLDAWGIPVSGNKQIYASWSEKHHFDIGDSLLFLYPPSQDSVVQVTEEAFRSCNTKDPILFMDNGNSLFNFTSPGKYYFTSGAPGHCQKSQKLEVLVGSVNASDFAPTMSPAKAPSYANAFGSIPTSSSTLEGVPVPVSVAIGSLVFVLLSFIQGRGFSNL